ncbi:MAG: RICIN domain-containing protein [Pseudomonadota bacterium]
MHSSNWLETVGSVQATAAGFRSLCRSQDNKRDEELFNNRGCYGKGLLFFLSSPILTKQRFSPCSKSFAGGVVAPLERFSLGEKMMRNANLAKFPAPILSIGWLAFIILVTPTLIQAEQSAPLPTILSFEITPTTVEDLGGEWIEFSWQTKDTDRVRLYEDGREIKGRTRLPNGELGFPATLLGGFQSQHSESATFELVAENAHGKATKRIVVPAAGVEPPPPRPTIVSFGANPTTVEAGEEVKFYWEVKHAERVRLYDNHGEIKTRNRLPNGEYGWPLSLSGEESMTQHKTTTYRLVAENREGKTARKTFTVKVRASRLQGRHTIQQKSNGRYLDAHEGSNDHSVVTRTRQNNTTQAWILTPLRNNTYTIQQMSSRRYMDAHEGSNDHSVVTRDRQNNTTQTWILTPLGNNTYAIQQMSSRRYMDAHEGTNDNSVVTRDRQNNDTQRWIIKPL